jgi:hypothetical protein
MGANLLVRLSQSQPPPMIRSKPIFGGLLVSGALLHRSAQIGVPEAIHRYGEDLRQRCRASTTIRVREFGIN